jgi:hypothetical protein
MPIASLSERLRMSPLLAPHQSARTLMVRTGVSLFRAEDEVEGKIGARSLGVRRSLGAQLFGRAAGSVPSWARRRRQRVKGRPLKDHRQNVIVKVAYHGHGGSGGSKLLAHGRYLERDGAGEDGEPAKFYDRDGSIGDAEARLEVWAEEDNRHFRIVVAPESGARFEDVQDLTRALMARMERDLGAALDWLAVNHHNTDNPHSHVILRGQTKDGVELLIPRDYVRYGLRHAAREIATQMLGRRGRADERLALDRETRAERFTRLDDILVRDVRAGKETRIQKVGKGRQPILRAALRNRVRELTRLGLVREIRRGVFEFDPHWARRLRDIGRRLDIKRALGRPIGPDQKRLRLYNPSMGRISGEVVEAGVRSEETGKVYLIVQDQRLGPVFVNTHRSVTQGLERGSWLAVEASFSKGSAARVSITSLSRLPLQEQIHAVAETELDREITRALGGQPSLLPSSAPVKLAIEERVAWHEARGSGWRDLAGRFEFAPGVLEKMRSIEFAAAQQAASDAVKKPVLQIYDGLERDWKLRSFVVLHHGRFAIVEREEGIAFVKLSGRRSPELGKTYSITKRGTTIKIEKARGLER